MLLDTKTLVAPHVHKYENSLMKVASLMRPRPESVELARDVVALIAISKHYETHPGIQNLLTRLSEEISDITKAKSESEIARETGVDISPDYFKALIGSSVKKQEIALNNVVALLRPEEDAVKLAEDVVFLITLYKHYEGNGLIQFLLTSIADNISRLMKHGKDADPAYWYLR